jgi:hypothetical protein
LTMAWCLGEWSFFYCSLLNHVCKNLNFLVRPILPKKLFLLLNCCSDSESSRPNNNKYLLDFLETKRFIWIAWQFSFPIPYLLNNWCCSNYYCWVLIYLIQSQPRQRFNIKEITAKFDKIADWRHFKFCLLKGIWFNFSLSWYKTKCQKNHLTFILHVVFLRITGRLKLNSSNLNNIQ